MSRQHPVTIKCPVLSHVASDLALRVANPRSEASVGACGRRSRGVGDHARATMTGPPQHVVRGSVDRASGDALMRPQRALHMQADGLCYTNDHPAGPCDMPDRTKTIRRLSLITYLATAWLGFWPALTSICLPSQGMRGPGLQADSSKLKDLAPEDPRS